MDLAESDSRHLACFQCGRIFDGDTGEIMEEYKELIITERDRGRDLCKPCTERNMWPDR